MLLQYLLISFGFPWRSQKYKVAPTTATVALVSKVAVVKRIAFFFAKIILSLLYMSRVYALALNALHHPNTMFGLTFVLAVLKEQFV